MHAQVVEVVRGLAQEHRQRFRASFVAERAGVPVDDARRDLVKLVGAGELRMNFELLSPFDDSTVATFASEDQIPTSFSSYDTGDGEEFEVTPELIWVTFSPTEEFMAEVADESTTRKPSDDPPPENPTRPRRRKSARGVTDFLTTSLIRQSRHFN